MVMDTSTPPTSDQAQLLSGAPVGGALSSVTWRLLPELPLSALDAAAPALTRLQVQLLANRGVADPNAAREFAHAHWHAATPPPAGLDAAIARVRRAAVQHERTIVFGDFDVDGLTSCAVMLLALRAIGLDAHPYIPSRDDDGRGLNEAAVRKLAAEGATLVVTTDCGVSNVEEVQLAATLGVDVVVTDHHPPQGAMAPAVAIVNPRQPSCPYPGKDLAGVGVAFRIAESLLAAAPAPASDIVSALLDLVAVGTIGDVVPLSPENWALVHAGLDRLNTAPRPGLRALADQAGLHVGHITERDISFALAPRLNAAGRMGDPMLALRLLVADDPAEAAHLAQMLQRLNEERQRATDLVMDQALRQARVQAADPHSAAARVLLAQGEGWPLGVIGLVAGRLAEAFDRPVIAASINGDECRASVRGPAGFNLVEALAARADLFRRFGGHAQAAGFTLPTAALPALVDHLRAAAPAPRASLDVIAAGDVPTLAAEEPAQPDEDLAISAVVAVPTMDVLPLEAALLAPADAAPAADAVPVDAPLPVPATAELLIDCRLPLRRVVPETYEAIRQLAPYGNAFPPPTFLASRVRIARCWRSGPEGRNLRIALREGTTERIAVWSRQGHLLPALRDLGPVDVVYTFGDFVRPGTPPEYLLRVLAIRPAQ